MSNYIDKAFNPVSGRIEGASWLDDHFGPHAYGVRFENEDHVYRPDEVALEKANEMIAALKAKLAEREGELTAEEMRERLKELARKWQAKSLALRSSVSGGLGDEREWSFSEALDECADAIRALSTEKEEG